MIDENKYDDYDDDDAYGNHNKDNKLHACIVQTYYDHKKVLLSTLAQNITKGNESKTKKMTLMHHCITDKQLTGCLKNICKTSVPMNVSFT